MNASNSSFAFLCAKESDKRDPLIFNDSFSPLFTTGFDADFKLASISKQRGMPGWPKTKYMQKVMTVINHNFLNHSNIAPILSLKIKISDFHFLKRNQN
jgi:hypothetical protein